MGRWGYARGRIAGSRDRLEIARLEPVGRLAM